MSFLRIAVCVALIQAPLSTAAAHAQSDQNGVIGFGRNVIEDLSIQARAPFRYAEQNPLKFAAGTLGVLTLIATDHLTRPALADLSHGQMERHLGQFTHVGDGRSGLLLVAGMGVFGLITGSEREKRSSIMLTEAVLTSAIWTNTMKALSGRERPREMEEQWSEWEGPDLLNGEGTKWKSLRSFPSGHSTGAWATATVLASQYPSYYIVPTLAYGTATAISYSRLVVGAHWLSDVVVGALIGAGSARQVMSAHARRADQERAEEGFRFGFDVSPAYQGFHLERSF